MPDAGDGELVAAFMQGDSDSLWSLLARHEARVYRLMLRLAGNPEDAEDMARESFIHLHKAVRRYDPRLPFDPWMMRVCRNFALNWLAKRRTRQPEAGLLSLDAMPGFDVPGEGASPEDDALERIRQQQALAALAALPDEYRVPIVLRFLEEMPFREIAETLQWPIGTVATRVRRGVAQLRLRMREADETGVSYEMQ